MITKKMTGLCVVLIITAIGTSIAMARPKKNPTPLTEQGKQLEAKYAKQLETLKAEIKEALPNISEQNKEAYLKAREAQKEAEARLEAAQNDMAKIGKAQGLIGHAKRYWIPKAEKGIAQAKAALKEATTDAEREAAKKELAKWEENKTAGLEALKERQAAYDQVKREEPKFKAELGAAQEALAKAEARTMEAVKALNLAPVLSSDKLDPKLVKAELIIDATPRGLAEYAQQGEQQRKLIESLLSNTALMRQMLVADGAKDGNYGRAMEIYNAIQKESNKADEGVLQRLALAISLEHAVPIQQRNAKAATNAPATVDPVGRYLHYEKAYLNGELDPGFAGHSAWDLRMVVDGNEPDEMLAWGREMLRNYRPDHITTDDYRWRYVAAVRTDIRYGSQDNKYDKDELQFFQNILMNGGVCGRRAFFGRFILRAFGIPTTARPQRGHAALTHWTPDGWVICLGAGWGSGWTKTRYKNDLDFLATTQARENRAAYLMVKRAQWIGDVLGEKPVYGFESGDPGFWYGLSLYLQDAIIQQAEAKTLAAVGEELGEANESDVDYAFEAAEVGDADRQIRVTTSGVIKIPAVATSKPTKSTGKIIFMPSILGGKQLHYSRNGGAQDFEYTFEAPAAGKYELTARVVTPSWKQSLLVTANDANKPVEIELPHTVGMWETTEPVEVELVEGENVLRFSHKSDGYAKGFTIKDFTLKPAN